MDDFLSDDKPKEFEDLNYELNMPASTNVEKSVAIFGRDMKMFDYIAKAMKEFYENPIYGGDFIEQIIVFENTKNKCDLFTIPAIRAICRDIKLSDQYKSHHE